MYNPRYTITNTILKNVGLVEAAREVIENAPLIPSWEAKFRDEARLKAAHYGTALEGNDLTFNEAKMVMEGRESEVVAKERDVQEVINYRKVLDFIGSNTDSVYGQDLLLQVHRLVTDKLISDEKSGRFRDTQVVLKNSVTGEIGFRPPAASEVPFLVDDFLGWLNNDDAKKQHPVIRAGITHYVLAAVHPFVEGNGRTARALATLVLFMEGYDIKRFFALEEYFDKNAQDYFGSLMQVSNQSVKLEERDLTPWLEVFTQALAVELSRIKETIKQLSVDLQIKARQGRQVVLSERQTKLVEYLNSNGELTMKEAKGMLPMVSEDTILRDLKDLMEKSVVGKKGSTKAAKYILKK